MKKGLKNEIDDMIDAANTTSNRIEIDLYELVELVKRKELTYLIILT
jgi:hypothetical protein